MIPYDVTLQRRLPIPRNNQAANSAVQTLIINQGVPVLGLDCEWVSTKPDKLCVALMQIATNDAVILFQTCKFEDKTQLPGQVAEVLRSESIIKVGVNIEEDVKRIRRQFSVTVRGWIDLRWLAIQDLFYLGGPILQQFKMFEANLRYLDLKDVDIKVKRRSFLPKLGLEALVANFLHLSIPKSKHLHIWGNWEAFDLSREQILYAATDAAVSFDVYYNMLKSASPLNAALFFEMTKQYKEAPYVHKEVRLSCLRLFSSRAPEMWQVLSDYYGCSVDKSLVDAQTQTNTDSENIRPRSKSF